jgi:hypothetical protein
MPEGRRLSRQVQSPELETSQKEMQRAILTGDVHALTMRGQQRGTGVAGCWGRRKPKRPAPFQRSGEQIAERVEIAAPGFLHGIG